MKRSTLLSLISFLLTAINSFLALLLTNFFKNLYNSTSNDLHYVYEYLTEILGYPSIKLIMIVLCYDVSYIFFTIFLNFCFYGSNEESDVNADNLREKSKRENKFPNLLLEFLFMFVIKGVSIGFSFFFLLKSNWEINRLLADKTIDFQSKQINLLKKTNILCAFMKWLLLINFIYVFWFYGLKISKHFKKKQSNKSYQNLDAKSYFINEKEKKGNFLTEMINRKSSDDNIIEKNNSPSESYQKLN